MNGTLRKTFLGTRSTSGRYAVPALVLLGVGALVQPAFADTLIPSESIFFEGAESTVLTLDTTSAGTVTVDVTDFEWPVALQSLSFSAASQSQVLKTETQSNPGPDFTVSFNVGGAGSFFAQISAMAGALPGFPNFPSIGAYSLNVSFTPQVGQVPLPPAVWLFASGLLAIAGAARVARRYGLPGESMGQAIPQPVSLTPV